MTPAEEAELARALIREARAARHLRAKWSDRLLAIALGITGAVLLFFWL